MFHLSRHRHPLIFTRFSSARMSFSGIIPSLTPVLLAAILAFFVLAALPTPALAQLTKATSAVQKLKDWIWIILPVICLIAGGICGLLYSFDVIRKETAYQWALGVTFAGAIAGGIIDLVF